MDELSRLHALYRFRDRAGALLYVGITLNPGARWPTHSHTQPWWTEVAMIQVESHPNRASALAAERTAIMTERPRYNVQHAVTGDGAPSTERPAPEYRPAVALCLRDGRCPVGTIDSWSDGWIELALYSWLHGYFGFEVRRYRESDVVEIAYARAMTDHEKRAAGEDPRDLVWSMDPLARCQTGWEHAHGRRTDADLVNDLATFVGR